MSTPALVGISHGTSSPDGQAAVALLMAAVAATEPGPITSLGYVDVQHPDTEETLADLPSAMPAVIVPLLLSAGYHVHVDLTRSVRKQTERQVRLAGTLGPDERLASVLVRRLAEAGFDAADSLVLAVAGSSDARAVADCRIAAQQLEKAIGHPVTLGFLSAAEPRLPEAVEAARLQRPGERVVVSSYLLAPGYFQSLAEDGGGDVTTGPLLAPTETPRELVDIVLDRYRAAL